MMKRLLSILTVATFGLALAAPGFAQSNQASMADVQQAKDTAAAATSTNNLSQTVPGYVDDSPSLQAMDGGDFSTMASQGTVLQSSHQATPGINANQAYQAANPIDANAAWVKNALQIEQDPTGTAAGAGGTSGETCTDVVDTIKTHSMYTCEEGVKVENVSQTCTLEYKHNVRLEYVYRCQATWVDGQAGLQPDARCTILQTEASCKLENTTCDTPSQPQTYTYSCSKGQSYTPSTATCSTSVTSEYQYKCNQNWVDGQPALVPDSRCNALTASGICTQTGSVCVTPSQTQSHTYSCYKGVANTGTNQSCSTQFSISNYAYKCQATLNVASGQMDPDARCNALTSSGVCSLASTTCTQGATPETASYACYSGTQYTSNNQTCNVTRPTTTTTTGYNYTCQTDDYFDNSFFDTYPADQYTARHSCIMFASQAGLDTSKGCGALISSIPNNCAPPRIGTDGTYLMYCKAPVTSVLLVTYLGQANNSCFEYKKSSSCTETGTTCVNTVNGICVDRQKTYTCTSATGPLTPTSTTTTGTVGPEDNSACQALASNSTCQVTGSVCKTVIDPGLAASQGLPVDTCLDREYTYSCQSSSAVNYCDAPAPSGAGWTCVPATSCVASGNDPCAITKTTYSCTRNAGATCSAEDRVYNCSSEVSSAAPVMRVDFSEDQSACTAIEQNPSCTLSGTTCQQMSNYSADVLAALGKSGQFCLKTVKDYTCQASTSVDYCETTPTGSGWTCLASAPTCVASGNDNCAQQKTTYNCSRTTGVNGCEALEVSYSCTAEVAGANPPENVIDSVNSSACQAIANNPTCHVTSEVCSQYVTKVVWKNKVPSPTTVCVAYNRTYTCDGYSPVDSCTASPPTGTGWTCTPTATCVASGSNPCAITKTDYNCTRSTGSNGCEAQTRQYVCQNDIVAVDPWQEIRKYQDGGGLVYNPACDAATNNACAKPPTYTCLEGPGTRVIDGVSVYADCWKAQEVYTCEAVTGTTNDCSPGPSCTLQETRCISDTTPCQTYEKVYDCVSSTQQTNKVCKTTYTANGSTIEAQDDPDNDLGRAAAAMNVLKESSDSYQQAADLRIFGGSDLRCRKAIFGLYNCCKDSGTFVDAGLMNCSADEQKLAQQQKNKACHYVGTYCSKKSFFGSCLEKRQTYCCYGSVLARIVQEAGHAQLGKPWGDPKGPQCGGFTVEEFEKIDLSNVDFSDFYADTLSKYGGDQQSTINAITNSLNNMQATKTPTK